MGLVLNRACVAKRATLSESKHLIWNLMLRKKKLYKVIINFYEKVLKLTYWCYYFLVVKRSPSRFEITSFCWSPFPCLYSFECLESHHKFSSKKIQTLNTIISNPKVTTTKSSTDIHFYDAIFSIDRWNRQSLYEIIGWIVLLRARKSLGSEKATCHRPGTYKREPSFAHQAYLVEHFKEFAGRLVNSEYNGLATACQRFYALDNWDGH